jgi:hypothetical protein
MTAPRRLARPAPLAVLAAFLIAAGPAAAQDAHYWNYNYGPEGTLTEGTVVGGVNDLSAVYYNPAALALADNPRFVVNLTSIEFARLDAPNAAGPSLDFESTIFDVVPAMIAGRIGSGDGNSRFAIAFLARQDLDWDLGYSEAQVSAASPDAYAGFGRVRQRVIEYWVAPSWSYRVGDRFSFGVSPFFAYRAQRSRRSLTTEQVSAGVSQSLFVGRENEYNHVRALAKLGVAWRPGSLELGATMTTPGFKLWSNGKAVFNATVAGAAEFPFLAASRQDGLESTYHSPLSVAGGATWRGERTAVHATVEWFGAVEPYEILVPDPAEVAGSTATVDLTFTGAGESVVNFGVGAERALSERLTLYGGVARNASSWRPEAETIASWDLIDATLGVTLMTSRWRLGFGVGYAWGSGDFPQAITPPGAEGARPTVEGDFSRWTFSFGASLNGSR